MNKSQELKKATVETASAAAEYSSAALKDGLESRSAAADEEAQSRPVRRCTTRRSAPLDFASKASTTSSRYQGGAGEGRACCRGRLREGRRRSAAEGQDVLHRVAEHLLVVEATQRGTARRAGVAGDFEPLQFEKKKSKWKSVVKGFLGHRRGGRRCRQPCATSSHRRTTAGRRTSRPSKAYEQQRHLLQRRKFAADMEAKAKEDPRRGSRLRGGDPGAGR